MAAARAAPRGGRSPEAAGHEPGRTVPVIGRLIVGTSGSPGSLRALRYGEFLARAHDAVLIPVIAWEPPGGERAERTQPSFYLRQECRDHARNQLYEALIAVWGEVPDDPLVEPHVERGPAGWVLVNLACRPADVLVVGAGRRGTVGRMAFSRVSRYCIAHAQCPVLAIPPPALARELWRGRLTRVFWHRPLTAEQIIGDQSRPAS
jgi:nucleotide-binding universal stress UspA family protein